MRVITLLLLTFVATAFAACSVTIPTTGKKLSFSKLASSTTSIPSADITGVPDGFGLEFRFCGVTSDKVRCTPQESAVCLHKGGAPQAVPGFWDDAHPPKVTAFENGVTIFLKGLAQAGERVFTTTFNIKCGSETKPTASINVADFVVSFSHPEACGGGGGGGGLSGGWIFLIILMVTTVVYIVAGCIFMHKRRGTNLGPDSCPNKAFWAAIPGLTKDGCLFTVAKLKGCCNKGSSSGSGSYEQDSSV